MKNNKIVVALLVLLLAFTCTLAACGGTTITITFDSNGGTSVDKVVVDEDNAFVKPADPTREGWIFAGWYTLPEAGILWEYNEDAVKADITVYAQWSMVEYIATFMIGEQKIAEVPFTTNDTVLSVEPIVTPKAGFHADWEEYVLNGKDITINAIYTAKGSLTEDELAEAVKKSGNIELSGDITLTKPLVISEFVELDGNHYTITYDASNSICIDGGGIYVTITDTNFDITATGNNQIAIHAYENSHLTLNNCDFTGMSGYYGTTLIAVYDSILNLNDCLIEGASQAVMVKTNVNSDETFHASAFITDCRFVDCGYAVFTLPGRNEKTFIIISESTFTNCATFIANNGGTFEMDHNTFKVGENVGADAHFKNTTNVALDIDKMNEIHGEYTTSGLVTIGADILEYNK